MDCSLPDSSVHGDSPGKNTGVGCYALLQGIFPIQGLKPGLLQGRGITYHLSHQGRSKFKGGQLWKSLRVCHPFVFPSLHVLVFDSVYILMRWVGSFISSISHAPLPSPVSGAYFSFTCQNLQHSHFVQKYNSPRSLILIPYWNKFRLWTLQLPFLLYSWNMYLIFLLNLFKRLHNFSIS